MKSVAFILETTLRKQFQKLGEKMNNRNRTIATILFIIVLSLAIFQGFGMKIIYLGSGFVLMAIGMQYYIVSKKRIDNKLYNLILLWIIFHLFLCIRDLSFVSIYISMQHIGIVLFAWYMINSDTTSLDGKILSKYLRLLHYSVMLFLLYLSLQNSSRAIEFENYVYIGLATISYAINKMEKARLLKITSIVALWVLITYKIGARAQIISYILFGIILFFLKNRSEKKQKVIDYMFIVAYTFLNFFPLIYTYLGVSKYRSVLDLFAISITGSRFFSGRDILWSNVYVNSKTVFQYIFGFGLTYTEEAFRTEMSLHSLYVTLFAEGGIIMIVLLGMIMFRMWKIINHNYTAMSGIVLAFIMVILYKQSFDISLIENNLWVAFGVWVTIGLGASRNELYASKVKTK